MGERRNILEDFADGSLLIRMNMDKLVPHILYTFIIVVMFIFAKMKIDQTLVVVEKNRKEIEALRIENAATESELVGLGKESRVEKMLQDIGSDVRKPEKPAVIIEK